MPRVDRHRIRRILRFKRLGAEITNRGRIRIGIIVEEDKKRVALKKSLRFRLKELEDSISRSIVYVHSEERRKVLMEIYVLAKAVRQTIERDLAGYEVTDVVNYGLDQLREWFSKIFDSATQTLHGIRKKEPSIVHELAQRYFTPLHPNDHHFTANMIRLTDLTMQFLEGLKGDYFVSYHAKLGDIQSPFMRTANVLLQLAEWLDNLMRRKSRREKVRNKSKGHYGDIYYDELVHTVINLNLVPVDELTVNQILGNTYMLARDKARSIGKPELTNRIINVGLYVIPMRKTYWSRKERIIKSDVLSYTYRMKDKRYW